ncbi:hypothetical protein tb265_48570 [Gemmatimonadetes bacterium T265]|nr:hypothetical protein tb265_48570 [Gemmatimonadetes bacterium T265]
MAKARTPNPSRIGKTLGAILSVPRRSATDESSEADASEPEDPNVPGTPDAPASDADSEPAQPHAPPETRVDDARAATRTAADPAPPTTAPEPLTTIAPAPTPTSATPRGITPDAIVDEADVDTDVGAGTRRKKRETFLLPEELADAMRNAIVHLSGPPLYYTLAEFGEHAIRSYIAELEREHNSGRPFPRRPRAVRQGRPLR